MKKILIIMTLIIIGTISIYPKPFMQTSVNFGMFYSSLGQYGDWFESEYGYAWRPLHIAHGWRPYLHGRWVWTDYGWYWVSNEPFGWATFHYGRWNYDNYYGWIWIPDYDWGPAWVEWCYNDNYIGWAPLSTYAIFNISIGITFRNHWVTPYHYWNFIPGRYFTSTRIIDYVQPLDRNRRIYTESRATDHVRFEGNRVVNHGIEVHAVEQRTNTRIRRIEVVDKDRGQTERFVRDGGKERIEVYRPRMEKREVDTRSGSTDIRQENRRSIKQPRRDLSPSNRDAIRNRKEIERRTTRERQIEPIQPQMPDVQRRIRERDKLGRQESFERRQEHQREQWQQQQEEQRMREQQKRENRNREIPRLEGQKPQMHERSTPQIRERQQSTQRPPERREESRGNTERRRRP